MLLSKNSVIDMPKLLSPFYREEINKKYVCVPKIREEFRWVFTEEAIAVEKLDGTNVSVVVRDGKIVEIWNRTNKIEIWKKGNKRFVEGILEAIEKGYFNPEQVGDGQYFGELIGPLVNGNPYKLETHLWIPFDVLKEKLRFKFWDKLIPEFKGKSDEEIFKIVDEVFKGLWSLFKRQRGIKGEVNENVGFEGMAAEGIVFYRKDKEINLVRHPDVPGGKLTTLEMCKLRRDMFGWFKGRRHGL